MASIFGHSVVAYTVAKVVDSKSSKLLVFLSFGSSVLPDLGVLGFFFGIDYLHPFGHRGFTHSILLTFLFGKSRPLIFVVVLFSSTISHGI
jgi:inner membrane protein